MDLHFDVDPQEFQERKRRRIATMNSHPPPAPKISPTSAPGNHEVATFLPGRLEFEHELDNDAEDLVKDLEFGICLEWGGDQIPEDEDDLDVKGRARMIEEAKMRESTPGKRLPNGFPNGVINGYHFPGQTPKPESPPKNNDDPKAENDEEAEEEPTQPPPIETMDSLKFKITLLEMYQGRVDKRHEAKALMFDRGLLNYKQVYSFNAEPLPPPPHCFRSDASKREEATEGGEGHRSATTAVCTSPDVRRLRSVCGGLDM